MESREGFSVFAWNINGIRTISIKDTLKQLNCDVLAVQETKISRDLLDEQTAIIDDYSSYYSFCRHRTGYSGVATYSRTNFTPIKTEEGLSDLLNSKYSRSSDDFIGNYCNLEEKEKSFVVFGDDDGRCIITQHAVQVPTGEQKMLTVINVYSPRLRDDPEDTINNKDFKLTFHSVLGRRAKSLLEAGSFVLIIGDYNISHKAIDRCEGVETEAFVQDVFRKWMDEMLASDFVDTFRSLYPTKTDAFSCWCTRTNARQNNYGSRIDYILADKSLSEYLEKAEIHTDIFGSDHCPISATFHSLIKVAAPKPPSGCTKYYPEFIGKQMKLKDFLNKAKNTDINHSNPTNPSSHSSASSSKSKRNRNTAFGRQTDIKSFFAKKPSLCPEIEKTSTKIEIDSSFRSESVVSETPFPVANDESLDISPKKSLKSETVLETTVSANESATKVWKNLMSAPDTPICTGHKEQCTLRTVRKKGLNQGRKFWACSKGQGQSHDPNGSCNYFLWANNKS